MMPICDSPRCFCSWPPYRLIPSYGIPYTIEELEPAPDGARRFRYVYVEAQP